MLRLRQQRIKFQQFEFHLKVISSILNNRNLKSSIRWFIAVNSSQKRKSVSKVRFKNRCVISGRSRSLYRFARLSRLMLRDPQYIGSLPGLQKSYW